MTIDEAIATLTSFISWFGLDFADRDLKAIKLAIEALKRIKDGRKRGYDFFGHLLPGETTEKERS